MTAARSLCTGAIVLSGRYLESPAGGAASAQGDKWWEAAAAAAVPDPSPGLRHYTGLPAPGADQAKYSLAFQVGRHILAFIPGCETNLALGCVVWAWSCTCREHLP